MISENLLSKQAENLSLDLWKILKRSVFLAATCDWTPSRNGIVYGYGHIFYGRQPTGKTSCRYVGLYCTCTVHNYRTSAYGQCLHPLVCHQLWLETMVMHQNCKGKHIQTEVDDICSRFRWHVHRLYKNSCICGSLIALITEMGPVIWAP